MKKMRQMIGAGDDKVSQRSFCHKLAMVSAFTDSGSLIPQASQSDSVQAESHHATGQYVQYVSPFATDLSELGLSMSSRYATDKWHWS